MSYVIREGSLQAAIPLAMQESTSRYVGLGL